MAITMQQVRSALDDAGLKYMQADDNRILMGFQGENLSLRLVVSLQEEGEYLQLRTFQYATCKPGDRHLERVLTALATLNYQRRLVKFGWDQSDGEIVGEADLPLEDNNSLSSKQLGGFLMLFLMNCDEGYKEIRRAIKPKPGCAGRVAVAVAACAAWAVYLLVR